MSYPFLKYKINQIKQNLLIKKNKVSIKKMITELVISNVGQY